jgi:hypothetical protein
MNLTGRPVMQKRPRVEARKLLDLVHDMPCFAAFPHNCTQHHGCVPAHANWLIFGKGHGVKVSDCFFASMCDVAHKIIDRQYPSDMSEDVLQQEWMRAYISTQDHLWRNKLVKVA